MIPRTPEEEAALLERPYAPPDLYIFEEVELGSGYHTLAVVDSGPARDWSKPYTKSGITRYRCRIVKVRYPAEDSDELARLRAMVESNVLVDGEEYGELIAENERLKEEIPRLKAAHSDSVVAVQEHYIAAESHLRSRLVASDAAITALRKSTDRIADSRDAAQALAVRCRDLLGWQCPPDGEDELEAIDADFARLGLRRKSP